jgi:hypothetical protein
MTGGFEHNTRQKMIRLATINKPVGGGISPAVELPKTGYLGRLFLSIAITTAGTITTQNALGAASAIKRVRLVTNTGIDLFNVSGVGYGYILQNLQELEGVNGRQPKNQFNSTLVTATTYNLDMVIPIMLNMHDTIGALLLQNEQLQVTLYIEWESDVNVILTGGGTFTGTAVPLLEYFTVPPDPADHPDLGLIHQIIEDQYVVAATGDYIVNVPRGNIYLQIGMGYGVKAAAVDNWNRLIARINQSDILYDLTPASMDQLVGFRQNLTRGLGQAYLDFLGSDGFGAYGTARDFLNTGLLTDFQVVLTATATDTLYMVRRMLVPLGQ